MMAFQFTINLKTTPSGKSLTYMSFKSLKSHSFDWISHNHNSIARKGQERVKKQRLQKMLVQMENWLRTQLVQMMTLVLLAKKNPRRQTTTNVKCDSKQSCQSQVYGELFALSDRSIMGVIYTYHHTCNYICALELL